MSLLETRVRILFSPDAANWSGANSGGTGQQLNSVAYGNNRSVVVGLSGTILVSEPVMWDTSLAMPLGIQDVNQPELSG